MTDQADRVKATARRIIELGLGMEPREFLSALAIATGMSIAAFWRGDAVNKTLLAHVTNLTDIVVNERAKRLYDYEVRSEEEKR